MNFLIFSAISGVLLFLAPVYIARRFRKEWKMPKGVFLKAGLALLLIELFHLSVLDSALSRWPDFVSQHPALQALILGVAAGLFFELGRFFMLDKFFRGVRSQKEGLYFALGWNGVETALYGALIVLGSYGVYLLATASDLSSLFPDAGASEMEQLKLYQEQAAVLFAMPALYGLFPIVERASLLALDMLLSLVMLRRFSEGTNRYVWLAVLGRGCFTAIIVLSRQFDPVVSLLTFAGLGILSYIGIRRMIRQTAGI